MGKRKEDQRRDDSSSICSDAKRRRSRHYQNGETSRTNNGTPWEGFAGVLRDAVIELKDDIQVKLSTEEKIKRKIGKIKEKRKKDNNKHEEDLRILKEELRILKENFRILQEGHEDLKSKIQEMRKEGYAEVDEYKASPSQRSQLSQSTRFRLLIENSVSRTIYKNETVETEDGGGHIKVVMYDGGNPIAPDHPLASVKVDLVVIEGRFNEPKRDTWSKEEFGKSIITPREGMIRLVKNGTFDLIGGSRDHPGAIIMDNSQKKEVKLGVMVAVHTEERVLEGVSNPFKVQEGKTKSNGSKKMRKKPCAVPMRNLVQPTSSQATQHGQGLVSPVCQHGLPPLVSQDVSQKEVLLPRSFPDCGDHTKFPTNSTAEVDRLSYPPAIMPLMVAGNGQDLNDNGQNFSQEILVQILGQSTSGHSIQHGSPTGKGYSWTPPIIQNQQAAVNQPLLARGQDQYRSLPNGSFELAHQNHSAYVLSNNIQPIFIPEDVRYSNAHTQMQPTYERFRCGRVLLQWDKPHVEFRERWNFLDELMPLYSTNLWFYGESLPSTSLMDKAHKLLGSISSLRSVWKMITNVTSRATQTPQKRGILIRPIEPYNSDDEPQFKKRRNAKYQLRFVNRVCNDYYTSEQIKSEDGTSLRIALYDENNLVVTSGPLSSACVEVVLLHGDFNAEGQDYWTSEEFSTCLVHPQSAKEPPPLGGDHVLALIDGETDLGNVSFQTSSFHARTGKFKMGVVIKNVREESVQEGITSPFLVRVRLGEEPSRHQVTSLEQMFRVRIKLPNQVSGVLERDAKENVGASSVLHDQSSQVISVLGVSTASERPPEPPSQVISALGASTASDQPLELLSKVVSVLGASTSSDRPLEPSWQGVEWSAPSVLLKERKSAEDVNHPAQERSMATAAGDGGGGGSRGGEGDGAGAPNKLMRMSERAGLAWVPQPELGLKCPRCDSTNTKFCYFNNYSLSQPRHFCRTCRRYWTRGGALCNVPVGGGTRQTKRSAKPKAMAAGDASAVAGTTSEVAGTTSDTSAAASCATCTDSAATAHQYATMFGATPPTDGRFADGFDPTSLGLSFPAWLLAAMQAMFHLGLQSGGDGGCGKDEDGDVINGDQVYNFYSSNSAGN